MAEQLPSASTLFSLKHENYQLRHQIQQVRSFVIDSRIKQMTLERKFTEISHYPDFLIAINDRNSAKLHKVKRHQAGLLEFVNNLETNRNKITSYFQTLDQIYNENSLKLSVSHRERKNYDVEVLKLQEQIHQQDEKLAIAMATHCKDQQDLSENKKKLEEAEKSKQSTKEKFETIQRQYKQQEEYWNKEKSQRLQHLEKMKEKFKSDITKTVEEAESLDKIRHEEQQQFHNYLKTQLQRNKALKAKVTTLQNQIEGKISTNNTHPTSSQRKTLQAKSPCSDVGSCKTSCRKSPRESIFKRRKLMCSGSSKSEVSSFATQFSRSLAPMGVAPPIGNMHFNSRKT
ncbi:uncharacterized protein LOC119660517 isoform X2 [Hermetia illucens]|uniref:uncharacterized protein LOC119660517 isoform X2 n=1 Tax=Hermetia illucens TaxID=343691 RepID=UPI0018CC2E66|nr:uncharacterized protein LOC119660517 isoform X2 [Hermetia illucens]